MAKAKNSKTRFRQTSAYDDNHAARSDSYQWKLQEIPMDPIYWNNYAKTAQEDHVLSEEKKDQLQYLQIHLTNYLWSIMEHIMTPPQLSVLKLFFLSEMTQQEIAKQLDRQQSAIHKSLFGVAQYSNRKGKVYGGSLHKLSKYLQTDSKSKELLQQIQDLIRDE